MGRIHNRPIRSWLGRLRRFGALGWLLVTGQELAACTTSTSCARRRGFRCWFGRGLGGRNCSHTAATPRWLLGCLGQEPPPGAASPARGHGFRLGGWFWRRRSRHGPTTRDQAVTSTVNLGLVRLQLHDRLLELISSAFKAKQPKHHVLLAHCLPSFSAGLSGNCLATSFTTSG